MGCYLQISSGPDLKAPAATAKGTGLDGNKWIALDGYSFGVSRSIDMVVGAQTNMDKGLTSFGEVSIRKKLDSGSELLMSYLYAPGESGQEVHIVSTKPSRGGHGQEVAFAIKLLGVRPSSSSYDADHDGQVRENYSLTYTAIDVQFYYETTEGKLSKGGLVGYTLPEGKCTSICDGLS